VLLGPVIVNIICYHVFLNPSGAVPAAVVTVLWLIVFYGKRQLLFRDIRATYMRFSKERERWLNGLSNLDTQKLEFCARHMMVTYVPPGTALWIPRLVSAIGVLSTWRR